MYCASWIKRSVCVVVVVVVVCVCVCVCVWGGGGGGLEWEAWRGGVSWLFCDDILYLIAEMDAMQLSKRNSQETSNFSKTNKRKPLLYEMKSN